MSIGCPPGSPEAVQSSTFSSAFNAGLCSTHGFSGEVWSPEENQQRKPGTLKCIGLNYNRTPRSCSRIGVSGIEAYVQRGQAS